MGPSVAVEDRGPTGGVECPGRQHRLLLLWALVFVAFRVLFPLARAIPLLIGLPIAIAASMLLSLFGPRIAAPLRVSTGVALGVFAVFGPLSLGVSGLKIGPPAWPVTPLIAAASDLCLILAAIGLGKALLRLFREPNLLVPAAAVAALVDYAMVYSPSGTTRAVLERHSEMVGRLSVQVPVPGIPALQLGIGFGDFVFFSLFLSAAVRFGLRERRTFWLCYAFLVAGMGVVAIVGIPVPALVPMGIAFLIANGSRMRFERSELVALGVAALLIAVAAGVAVGVRGLAH